MRPKIYLFGDSITEESFGDGGWGASLAHHLSRSVFPKNTESLIIFVFLFLFLFFFGFW
jgi:hypothetical protein